MGKSRGIFSRNGEGKQSLYSSLFYHISESGWQGWVGHQTNFDGLNLFFSLPNLGGMICYFAKNYLNMTNLVLMFSLIPSKGVLRLLVTQYTMLCVCLTVCLPFWQWILWSIKWQTNDEQIKKWIKKERKKNKGK